MQNDQIQNRSAKRLKAGGACSFCRKRKLRCDAERPQCLSCKIRGIVCQYPVTNLESFSVEQLEALVELRRRGRQDTSTIGSDIGVEDDDEEDQAPKRRLLSRSSKGQASASTVSPTEHPINRDPAVSPSQGYLGESSTFAFVTQIRPGIGNQEEDEAESAMLDREQYFEDAKYEFPSRNQANELVKAYFDRVHVLYPFVHAIQFRAQYEEFWHQASTDVSTSWLAVLNIIFAYGCEFCPSTAQINFLAAAKPFVDRARTIILSLVFETVNLELVQAQLMLCHYLQSTLQLNHCWNLVGLMIRSAYALGLHIDTADDETVPAIDKEMRRRVFWGCTALDRTLSMKLGRPPSIPMDEALNVPWPAAVDDQYIIDSVAHPRQPSQLPSRMAFFVQTAKMAPVNDIILKTLYFSRHRRREPDGALPPLSEQSKVFSDAVHLDGLLRAWWNELPVHLRLTPKYPDGAGFARQRSVFKLRYLNMRTLLHRAPFLVLCKQPLEDDFLRQLAVASSKVCIATASETVQQISSQYKQQLLNSLWYNLHYIFTAMGVLLTICTLDKTLQDLLEPLPDPKILDAGMEFLRSASNISTLAGRYVHMLERFRQPYDTNHGGGFGIGGNHPRDQGTTEVLTIEPISEPNVQPPQSNLPHMDPYDLLFGTGVPHNIFHGDWSRYPDLY